MGALFIIFYSWLRLGASEDEGEYVLYLSFCCVFVFFALLPVELLHRIAVMIIYAFSLRS
jgi:hypothetical protein